MKYITIYYAVCIVIGIFLCLIDVGSVKHETMLEKWYRKHGIVYHFVYLLGLLLIFLSIIMWALQVTTL